MARSKYQLGIRGKRGNKRRHFDEKSDTNRMWLKARHRVRRKVLGG